MDLETIKQKPIGEVQDYVLTTLPKMYQAIQERCQSQKLSSLQLLGFLETVFNGLLCSVGLMNNELVIRWPRDYDILLMAKQTTKHDWFLIPDKTVDDPRAMVYISALKTANVVFDYLLKMNDSTLTSQILWQAMKQGALAAKQNHLPIKLLRNDTAILIQVLKEGEAAGEKH